MAALRKQERYSLPQYLSIPVPELHYFWKQPPGSSLGCGLPPGKRFAKIAAPLITGREKARPAGRILAEQDLFRRPVAESLFIGPGKNGKAKAGGRFLSRHTIHRIPVGTFLDRHKERMKIVYL